MDKDIIVQIRRRKDGYSTECCANGKDMLPLMKCLEALITQIKGRVEEKVEEIKKKKQESPLEINDIKKKLEQLDQKGMNQFLKDVKGLLKGN